MSKRASWQRRVLEENSMSTLSASVERRLSSEHLQSQNYRGMTTTCCPKSNRSFWWGFAPDITDWTVICTVNWSWHPHQLAPVVEMSRPRSMFYKDAPFTKPQEKTCGLSALSWRPNSMAANRSWRRRHHSSPERPWSSRLRTPRRTRQRCRLQVAQSTAGSCKRFPPFSTFFVGVIKSLCLMHVIFLVRFMSKAPCVSCCYCQS